jgi:hypothetical protein
MKTVILATIYRSTRSDGWGGIPIPTKSLPRPTHIRHRGSERRFRSLSRAAKYKLIYIYLILESKSVGGADLNDGYRDPRIRVQISKIGASVSGKKMSHQARRDKDTWYIIHKHIPKLGMIVVYRPDARLGRWRYAPPMKCQSKSRGGLSPVRGSFRKFQTMRFFQPNDVGYIGDIRSHPQRCPTLRPDVLEYRF